jgi:[ribosomal protein S5]-alanine N-acetyltransferase
MDGSGGVAGTLTIASVIRGLISRAASATGWPSGLKVRGLRPPRSGRLQTSHFGDLRLHRIQAETLTHKPALPARASARRLDKYGEARSYMHIAGEWQDNVLYQLLTPTPERVVTYR